MLGAYLNSYDSTMSRAQLSSETSNKDCTRVNALMMDLAGGQSSVEKVRWSEPTDPAQSLRHIPPSSALPPDIYDARTNKYIVSVHTNEDGDTSLAHSKLA